MSQHWQEGVGGCALLLLVLGGCAARTSNDASAGAGVAACSGDLTVERAYPAGPVGTTAPLHCALGVVGQALGLGQLQASSANIDSLQLDLPALETGSYAFSDCAGARLRMAGGLYDPNVFGPTAAQAQVALNLERGLAEVTGSVEAYVCREIGQQMTGDVTWPIYDCVTISIPNFRARIEPASACSCPSQHEEGGDCEVGVCSAANCATVKCPWNSAICKR